MKLLSDLKDNGEAAKKEFEDMLETFWRFNKKSANRQVLKYSERNSEAFYAFSETNKDKANKLSGLTGIYISKILTILFFYEKLQTIKNYGGIPGIPKNCFRELTAGNSWRTNRIEYNYDKLTDVRIPVDLQPMQEILKTHFMKVYSLFLNGKIAKDEGNTQFDKNFLLYCCCIHKVGVAEVISALPSDQFGRSTESKKRADEREKAFKERLGF